MGSDSRRQFISDSFLVIFLCLLVACTETDSSDYFPLREGRILEYRQIKIIRDEVHESRQIVRTLSPVMTDGKKLYRLEKQGEIKRYFNRNEDGIFSQDQEKKTPFLYLPISLRNEVFSDRRWQLPSQLGVVESRTFARQDRILNRTHRVVLRYSVIGQNVEVDVPAGRFRHCLKVMGIGSTLVRVDRGNGIAQVEIENTDWYAPGVGLVKTERIEKSDSPFLKTGRYTLELLRYQ